MSPLVRKTLPLLLTQHRLRPKQLQRLLRQSGHGATHRARRATKCRQPRVAADARAILAAAAAARLEAALLPLRKRQMCPFALHPPRRVIHGQQRRTRRRLRRARRTDMRRRYQQRNSRYHVHGYMQGIMYIDIPYHTFQVLYKYTRVPYVYMYSASPQDD